MVGTMIANLTHNPSRVRGSPAATSGVAFRRTALRPCGGCGGCAKCVVVQRRGAPLTRQARVVKAQASTNGAVSLEGRAPTDANIERRYLAKRSAGVTQHFPTALGVDDFMQRLEVALWGHGFENDNCIAMVNLCRDEVTHTLKHKIDQVYGMSFQTHGLGGVLTCGVTGVGAGLSHSPLTEGKERYIFFSFPHIAIDSQGTVGNISRPGRAAMSCACGAVIKCLGQLKGEGLAGSCKAPGVHEPLDIEYSILKQRLARRLTKEGHNDESVKGLDLVELTKATERVISDDLDYLIGRSVDVSKADYAVITGVQIHNWSTEFDSEEPNLEFVAPTQAYVVVDGERYNLDLQSMPPLTPRQIRLLASAPDAHYSPQAAADAVCNAGGGTTLREIDPPYMVSSKEARLKQKERLASFATLAAAAAARAIPAPATAAPAAPAAPTRAPIAAAAPAAAPAAPTAPVAAPAAPTAAPAAVPTAVPAADTAGSGLNRQRLQQLAAQASPDEYWQHAERDMYAGWNNLN